MTATTPYPFVIADVFTATPFGGNQLAVIPDARGLSATTMHALAREFNFAESAFVFPPDDAAHLGRVRIFTPTTELPFAGHPSVGTAAVLLHLGLAGGAAEGSFVLEEGVGPVTMEYRQGDTILTTLVLDTLVDVRNAPDLPAAAAAALSLPVSTVRSARFASVGVPFCLVHLDSADSVDRGVLDQVAWSSRMRNAWSPNLFLFAGETCSGGQLHARMFGPAFGIAEDPATGSAAAALAGALASDTDGAEVLRWDIAQGVAMGRPSRLQVSAQRSEGGRVIIRVGGSTVIVAEGTIRVPVEA